MSLRYDAREFEPRHKMNADAQVFEPPARTIWPGPWNEMGYTGFHGHATGYDSNMEFWPDSCGDSFTCDGFSYGGSQWTDGSYDATDSTLYEESDMSHYGTMGEYPAQISQDLERHNSQSKQSSLDLRHEFQQRTAAIIAKKQLEGALRKVAPEENKPAIPEPMISDTSDSMCWDWEKMGECPRGPFCQWRHGYDETVEAAKRRQSEAKFQDRLASRSSSAIHGRDPLFGNAIYSLPIDRAAEQVEIPSHVKSAFQTPQISASTELHACGKDWDVELDPQIDTKMSTVKKEACLQTPVKTPSNPPIHSTKKENCQLDRKFGCTLDSEDPHSQPWHPPSWAAIVKNKGPPPGFAPRSVRSAVTKPRPG